MTTAKLIAQMIAQRADDIVAYIRLGWAPEAAIDFVRERSTLGPQAWDRVLASVTGQLAADQAQPCVSYDTKPMDAQT